MNLLFDFLMHLRADELESLQQLKLKGTTARFTELITAQALTGSYKRETIIQELQITDSHFDKLTSEVLQKAYHFLSSGDGYRILDLLSKRIAYTKHFYKEQKRQLQHSIRVNNPENTAALCRHILDLIHYNLPIVYKDERVLKSVSKQYISTVQTVKKERTNLFCICRQLFVQIDKLYAATTVEQKGGKVLAQLEQLKKSALITEDAECCFEFYWSYIYYYLASADFVKALQLVEEAIELINSFKNGPNNFLLRLQMRRAELLYFTSRFSESYTTYHQVIESDAAQHIPELGYHATKYFQVCLITGNLYYPAEFVKSKYQNFGKRINELIPPRDIFSFIKYYLFAGKYDEAHQFVLLGFEKNPKAKYFQYEVELRNLQTALFYLTGQLELALEMCERHIKYLRSHGYKMSNSNYPYFFALIKAIHKERTHYYAFTDAEKEKYELYQTGSYAVYGKILRLIRKKE